MTNRSVARDGARQVAGVAAERLGLGRAAKRSIERLVRRGSTSRSGDSLDVARQAANVTGALFQVGMTALAGAQIQRLVDEGPPSLVEPAGYAFSIWAGIFGLSLAYAAYQARPATRDRRLLRSAGWFTAVAFACTGAWSVVVPERLLLLALAALVVAWVCLSVAYRRTVDAARDGDLSRGECWLVVLPVGVFLGWLTAAIAVSLVSEIVRFGVVGAGSAGEPMLGAAVLLLGGALAAAVVRAGRDGPPQAYVSYGATVLWALAGVVVNQYDTSNFTTGSAALAAAPVLLALIRNRFGGRPLRHDWRRFAPDSA